MSIGGIQRYIYFNALKDIPGAGEKNRAYQNYIRHSIEEVFSANPRADEAEVRELLGDPQTVRDSYIQSLSDDDLRQGKREQRKKTVRRLVLILPIILIFAGFAGFYIRCHFFLNTTVLIQRPVNRDAERYVEFPKLVTPGTSLVSQSARSVLRERVFIDNVMLVYQEFEQKYPEKCHITCTVTSDKNGTAVLWTGTGVTAEGVTEDVHREYMCEYRFKVEDSTEPVNERARQAQETTEQALG